MQGNRVFGVHRSIASIVASVRVREVEADQVRALTFKPPRVTLTMSRFEYLDDDEAALTRERHVSMQDDESARRRGGREVGVLTSFLACPQLAPRGRSGRQGRRCEGGGRRRQRGEVGRLGGRIRQPHTGPVVYIWGGEGCQWSNIEPIIYR